MSDTPADRLRKARARLYPTAAAAIEANGWNGSTYHAHENGQNNFKAPAARKYGKAFNVTASWLLTGENGGDLDSVPIVGLIGADPSGEILYAEGQAGTDTVPPPPGGGANGNTVAVEVRGHSMRGLADNGAIIYYDDRRNPPTDDMIGQPVVVGLDTGEVMVKRLFRGSKPGLFDLESMIGETRRDARVEWAAHVAAVIPPVKARQIIRRG